MGKKCSLWCTLLCGSTPIRYHRISFNGSNNSPCCLLYWTAAFRIIRPSNWIYSLKCWLNIGFRVFMNSQQIRSKYTTTGAKTISIYDKFGFIFLDKLWWSLGWLKKYVTSFVKWVTYNSTPFCHLLPTIEYTYTQKWTTVQSATTKSTKMSYSGSPFCCGVVPPQHYWLEDCIGWKSLVWRNPTLTSN